MSSYVYTARDLWSAEDEIDRGPYLAIGFTLMALKYNLERLVAGLAFGHSWSVLAHYLHTPDPSAVAGDTRFYATMVAMTLPFLWTGVALTIRRLRSAGLPIAFVALFFVPVVNLIFFLLLAALPAAEPRVQARSSFLSRLIPRSAPGSALFVLLLGGIASVALGVLSTRVFFNYGSTLFIGLPFCLGLTAALVHGYHATRSWFECAAVACMTVFFSGLVLFATAVEGVICLALALPLALPLAVMGGTLGWMIQRLPHRAPATTASLLLLFAAIPALIGAESEDGIVDRARPVRTSIDIAAAPETVWRNVVAFSDLPAPAHWIFRLGFAYPLRATIVGRGVGAVRHCEFTTGPFVEPITVWDEPRLLKFSVTSQPPPMRETSWYPDMRPAHLDGFLVSEGGQFELTPLPDGRTRLTGTTWYRHEIRPSWYWRPWSNFIIHRIHQRVLAHIQSLSQGRA